MAPGPSFSSFYTQFFPPKPEFTDKDLPDLSSKVYIITGANTGIGKELARVLYSKNAKVYIAARSEEKAKKAIQDIQEGSPNSSGALVFLPLDLSDLQKVKEAALSFLDQEKRLDVLFNNAGVMVSPENPPPKTVQGYELSIGVNCVGHFLFTKLLTPLLAATAASESAGSIRVVWLSSFGLELSGAKDVGVDLDNIDFHIPKPATERYGISKAGAWALGVEFARRHRVDGIISLPINPGNIKTELARDQGFLIKLAAKLICYDAALGACTLLFAGFSPDVTLDKSGSWVIPFGRFYPLRSDLVKATKLESEGGTAGAYKFWEWNEQQVKPYI